MLNATRGVDGRPPLNYKYHVDVADQCIWIIMLTSRRPPWDGLQRVANDDKESLEFLNDSFILKLENGETKINDF